MMELYVIACSNIQTPKFYYTDKASHTTEVSKATKLNYLDAIEVVAESKNSAQRYYGYKIEKV